MKRISGHNYSFIVALLVTASLHGQSVSTSLESILRRAALAGDRESCLSLIQQGADVSAQGRNGFTALHISCQQGFLEISELLIDSGANVHTADESGSTPLHVSCAHGRYQLVELLLNRGANVNEQQKTTYLSPLHIACVGGHREVCELLLGRGALVHAQSKEGFSPLHSACQLGHDRVIEPLLTAGAKTDILNVDGRAPLHLAVMAKSIESCKLLVKMNANINVQTRGSRKTALHIACLNGFEPIAKYLIQSGASLEIANSAGETPLFAAVRTDHASICEFLIQFGAKKDVTDAEGVALMSEASGNDRIKNILTKTFPTPNQETVKRAIQQRARYAQAPVRQDPSVFVYQQAGIAIPPQPSSPVQQHVQTPPVRQQQTSGSPQPRRTVPSRVQPGRGSPKTAARVMHDPPQPSSPVEQYGQTPPARQQQTSGSPQPRKIVPSRVQSGRGSPKTAARVMHDPHKQSKISIPPRPSSGAAQKFRQGLPVRQRQISGSPQPRKMVPNNVRTHSGPGSPQTAGQVVYGASPKVRSSYDQVPPLKTQAAFPRGEDLYAPITVPEESHVEEDESASSEDDPTLGPMDQITIELQSGQDF